jgi:hypothetical protein
MNQLTHVSSLSLSPQSHVLLLNNTALDVVFACCAQMLLDDKQYSFPIALAATAQQMADESGGTWTRALAFELATAT